MIDLGSDTLTRPTEGMRQAMAAAEVGDDVYGEDPTVNELEHQVAARLGKEAALYVPSGTMSNQIAVRVHCQPGDEFLCDSACHIFRYEQGAFAQLFGIAPHTIDTDDGLPSIDQLAARVRPDDDHYARSRLVCLENTFNCMSGRVLPYEYVQEVTDWAAAKGLARHLDGARLFNAVVATGIDAARWAAHFDTVSICFSKGLGAPVGSALCGTHEAITAARRLRKVLGGGMRQAGVIAAGALYALEHHVDRLAEDHAKAQILADAVRQTDGLTLPFDPVETNIVLFEVDDSLGTAEQLCGRLLDQGVRMFAGSARTVRAVTHIGVSEEEVARAARILGEVAS